jgi:aspartate kinase
MDKTTNALEELANFATQGKEQEAFAKLGQIDQFHKSIVYELFDAEWRRKVLKSIDVYFNELEQIIRGLLLLGESSNRIYDRIMAFGELLSSVILSNYLEFKGANPNWVDSRTIIHTDSNFKAAGVVWSLTTESITQKVKPLIEAGKLVIAQGYIGANAEGYTTTLGREGSDYTASIFGHILDAERVITWKDVPGIMSGDPKIVPNAVQIQELTYEQAVEMTFYGASVIHPKTIKPLQNKGIPLEVKSFNDIDKKGTIIGPASQNEGITTTLFRKNQALISIRPYDFSFMDVEHLQRIFTQASVAGLEINLIQTSAISLNFVVNYQLAVINQFISSIQDYYTIELQNNLVLKSVLNADLAVKQPPANALLVQRERNNVYLLIKPDDL